MTDTNEKKLNNKRELKALSLILFVVVGFYFINKDRLLIFGGLSTFILFIVGAYIRINNLKISKTIYYLFISFYNIASIFFLVDYHRGQGNITKLDKYIFDPFIIGDKIDVRYVVWILILTIVLFIIESTKKNPDEENNDR